jgi:hypothetical protein
MNAKKGTGAILLFFLFLLFFAGQLSAQLSQVNAMYRFRKIAIPVDMQFKDLMLAKGEYDLEFVRVPSSKWYFLRFMKKGKILHLLQGEEFRYEYSDTIPREPKLHMSMNRDEKTLLIIFESGWGTRMYPKIRARFCCNYQEI